MKIKRSNVITAMICTIALSISYYSGTVAGKSDADLGEYKSQGKIVFNNGTESGNDDVIFDATDFQKIDDLVTNGKFKIKSELDKYENVSTSDFPTFDEMASAIDAISSGTDAAPKDILSTKKALVNKSIVIGQMPDNSGTEKDAGEITHDDDYTYFSVPEDGYYTVDSKIRGLNSDIADNIPPDIIANHIRQILFKANTDPVNALYDGVGFAQSVDGCRVFINGTLAGEIFTNTQIRINFKKNDVITFARIGNSTVYFYYAYFFETSTK